MNFTKLLLSLMLLVFISSIFSMCQKSEAPLRPEMQRGQALYIAHCQSCHMANGEGIASVMPPLAKADYMLEDRERAIKETLFGVKGEMVINGITYNGDMPATYIDDQETADLLTYIFNSWGNQDSVFTKEEVAKVREANK